MSSGIAVLAEASINAKLIVDSWIADAAVSLNSGKIGPFIDRLTSMQSRLDCPMLLRLSGRYSMGPGLAPYGQRLEASSRETVVP